MNLVGLAPLFLALLVAGVVPLAEHSRRVDATMTRVARRYFGRYVTDDAPERKRRLRAAYVDETYRSYAAKTYLITALAAVSGVTLGVYVTGGVLLVLPGVEAFIETLPDAMAAVLGRIPLTPELTENQVFAVLTGGGTVLGGLVAGGVYWYRWEGPRSHAEVRRRGINEGLPRTVAFVYALSRGGMAVPDMLRTLADNREVYGHGADELSVAVRQMDLFGQDVVAAVRHVSSRTPSEQFKTFAENLGSVLQSGQNLERFLKEQYERYRDEAVDRQEEILELLATIAEAYVTTLVAGTLFLMTILLVFGLTTTNTLTFLQLLAYLLIPLANLLFVVYLSSKLELLGVARGSSVGSLRESLDGTFSLPSAERTAAKTDGGYGAGGRQGRQLAAYDGIKRVKRVAANPVQAVLRRPTAILYVTVPLALLSIALRLPGAFASGGLQVRSLDDILIQALLFVLISFAVVWEVYTRRIARMEDALPELLDRMASLNEAGMSVVEGLDRVRETDLGVLSEEVDRVWRDVKYGATVDDAFRRFGLRVRTTSTTRVVTLLTNALRASGNLGPVLRVAAEQASSELTLRRKRRQQMLTYLVVIYISFLVFLVIIVAVQEVLVPSLPNNVPTPDNSDALSVDAGSFARFGEVDKAAYTLVFFHTALVQAVLSGFIGGQIGEGSLKDGAKHAAIMLGIAYVAFLLLSTPVAGVTMSDQQVRDGTVTVDSVSMSKGGFVVVRSGALDGDVVGHSDYLSPGQHDDVRIEIDRLPYSETEVYAVPHRDGNGNKRFDGAGPESPDPKYPTKRTRIFDTADVTGGDSVSAVAPPSTAGSSPQPSVGTAESSVESVPTAESHSADFLRTAAAKPADRRVSGALAAPW